MANISVVFARIDTNLKDNAESILSQLGITPSSAIQMLYSQIVLKKGMPFELKLPFSKPLAVAPCGDNLVMMKVEKIFKQCIKAGESVCKTDFLRFLSIFMYMNYALRRSCWISVNLLDQSDRDNTAFLQLLQQFLDLL